MAEILMLSSICSIIKQTPQQFDGYKEYVATGDLQNSEIISSTKVTYQNRPSRADCTVKSGDILFAKMAATEKTLIAEKIHEDMLFSTGFAVLRPISEVLDSAYLYHVLRSEKFLSEKDRLSSGATQKAITNKALLKMKICIPSLNEQRIIAAILDKSGEIKQTSEYVMSMRQQLLLSTFYEMFHSNQSTRSIWPIMNIEELALKRKNSMRTGPFGSNLLHSEFVEEGIPVLGIDNVVDNVFKWKKERYITEEKYHSLKRYTVFPGDLLVTIMGTVGRTAVCPDDLPVCINTKHLACITLNQEMVHPLFLSYSLRHDQEIITQIKLKNRGAIMDGLNLTLIKSLKLAIPPIELQLKFVKVMNAISNFGEINKFADDASLSLAQEMLT